MQRSRALISRCSTAGVTPRTADFLRSIEFVTMAVLGGLGSIIGSIVGAALLTILPQVLTVFHDYEHVVLGLHHDPVHDLPARGHRAARSRTDCSRRRQ